MSQSSGQFQSFKSLCGRALRLVDMEVLHQAGDSQPGIGQPLAYLLATF